MRWNNNWVGSTSRDRDHVFSATCRVIFVSSLSFLFSFNKLVVLGVILDLCSGDRFFHRFFPSGLLAVLLLFLFIVCLMFLSIFLHFFLHSVSFYFLKAVEVELVG